MRKVYNSTLKAFLSIMWTSSVNSYCILVIDHSLGWLFHNSGSKNFWRWMIIFEGDSILQEISSNGSTLNLCFHILFFKTFFWERGSQCLTSKVLFQLLFFPGNLPQFYHCYFVESQTAYCCYHLLLWTLFR